MKPYYTLSDLFKSIFSPSVLAPYLGGVIAVGVCCNAVYGLLQQWLGQSANSNLSIIIVSAIVFIAAAIWLHVILSRRMPAPLRLVNKPRPAPRKGLIFLVSSPEVLLAVVNYHHKVLKHCWLIATDKSWKIASDFKEKNASQQLTIELHHLHDEFSWEASRKIITKIFRNLPGDFGGNDVITDLTGLTKPATAGAVLACLNAGRPMQYTPATYKNKDGQPDPLAPIEPFEIIMDRQMLFEARSNSSNK